MSHNLSAPGLAESIIQGVIEHICSCSKEAPENLCVLPLLNRSEGEFCSLVYHKAQPKFFIHFHTDNEKALEHANLLTKLSLAQAPAPKLLGMVDIQGTRVNIQEYPDGPSLELLLNAGLMQTEEALSKSSSWIDDLWETTQEPSNAAALASELHGLLLIAKEHSLLSQYSLERVQEVLMDTVSSGLRINQSLVIPQLTLKDIVISEQLLCRNLVRGEFSHFHFCNWFSLLEHSPSLTSCEFEGAKLPKSIKVGAMGDSALAAMQIVFDLKSLRYLLTELPASLHPRAVDRYREVFASLEKCETVPRQALDPIVPAAGMPKVSGTNTLLSPELGRLSIGLLEANQRYSATQFDLAQRNRELGEAKAEIDVLHHELENTRRDLSEISENLEDLGDSAEANRQIAVLQNQLAHRDEILQSIVKSPGFRLGHAVTSVAKKVPGLNKVASALKK